MTEQDNIQIRDQRKSGWFWVDTRLVKRDGKVLGVDALAVYCVLASYANNDTQEAFPGIRTIAKMLSISATTVREAIDALKINGWITVSARKSEDGKQHLSHVYTLIDAPDTAAVLLPQRREGGTAAVTELSPVSLSPDSPDVTPSENGATWIFQMYLDVFKEAVSAGEHDALRDLAQVYTQADVKEAMTITHDKHARQRLTRKVAYLRGILQDWSKNGKPAGNGATPAPLQRAPTLEELGYKVVR